MLLYLARRTDLQSAEDILGETFVTALVRWGSFDPDRGNRHRAHRRAGLLRHRDPRIFAGSRIAATCAVADRLLRQGSVTPTAWPAELIRRRRCVGGVRSEHASDRLVPRHVPRNAAGEALFRRTGICLSHDGPVTGTLPAEGPACGAFVLSHGHHSQLCSTAGPISFHCRASVRFAAG
ncbi:hypothetical protein JYQ29_11920 [Curtobacterium flaccumfaciens pv. flaccumfaciens]|nr:hypothetical protein [Curtobacterium flaccumfaciens pv. flaccumfaciens]MBO9057692.1 hypothetical protein [Curtobacterium flaccumfaciens pv. flaccumfaciens]